MAAQRPTPRRGRHSARRRGLTLLVAFALPLTAAPVALADTNPTVSIGSAAVVEGDAGTVALTLPVTLSSPSLNTVTVGYATQDGVATAPVDYQQQSGTLTFTPGQTSQSVVVSASGDVLDEAESETFSVTLSAPVNAVVSPYSYGQGTATIIDDDGDPVVSAGSPTVVEGSGTGSVAAFRLTLAAPSPRTVTVRYATQDGTAVAGKDYATRGGTATFTPGQRTKTVNVPITGDRLPEGHDEYLYLNLSSCTGCTLPRPTSAATIVDDDSSPWVSAGDVVVNEGSTGTSSAVFTVTLSAPAQVPVTVKYSTSDFSAAGGPDYTAANGTVRFAVGESSKPVTVAVKGDTTVEPDEHFALNLSSPVNARLLTHQAFGLIRNDDGGAPPSSYVSVGDAVVTEGSSGSQNATFTLRLSSTAAAPVVVDYRTVDNGARSLAPGADYTPVAGSSVTIPAGASSATVDVAVLGDTRDEEDEQFLLEMTSVTGASFSRPFTPSGSGVVNDDDDDPVATISDGWVKEGDTGSATVPLTVDLSAASPNTVTVNYATADSSARSGTDYTATSGAVVFAPGETSKPIGVPVLGDTLDEGDAEQLSVSVTASTDARQAVYDSPAVVVVQDDDTNPVVSVDAPTVTEADTSPVQATFQVSLSGASPHPVTVDYATTAVGAGPSDFTSRSGRLTFAPGEVTKPVAIDVLGDTLSEPTEYVGLSLGATVNGTSYGAVSYATIHDNDVGPSLSVSTPTVTEGTGTGSTATYQLTLSSPSSNPVSVTYSTQDYEAVSAPAAEKDYTPVSGTLTFAPGQTSKSIPVSVVGDSRDETDESFLLNVTEVTNAVLGGSGYGYGLPAVIQDDDTDPTVSVSDPVIVEGNVAKNVLFTFSLSSPKTTPVLVDYTTGDYTAAAGSDYTARTGTLTIPAGSLSANVAVSVLGDTVDEDDESFYLYASNPRGASLAGDGYGYATVIDNDGVVSGAKYLTVSDATLVEGSTGTAAATFTVTLTPASTTAVTADWSSSSYTARSDTDFVADTDTLTFAPSETTKTFTVLVNGDTLTESNESFFVSLSPTGASAVGSAYGVILDDDTDPTLTVSDAVVSEPDTGTVTATVTASLSSPSSNTVFADLETSDVTASSAEGDYVPYAERLEFAPGETSKTVSVTVNGDTRDEDDEIIGVRMSGVVNARLSTSFYYGYHGSGGVRILDTDLHRLTVTKTGNGATAGTVTSAPAGISCGADCTEDHLASTSVTLSASAPLGYVFDGWSGACTGTAACTVAMSQARTVTAAFSIQTFPLTVVRSGAGSGSVTSTPAGITCGTTCTSAFDHGTLVTLTPVAAPGSTFTGWAGDCTGTGACTVTMTAARSVSAGFALLDQTLTVSRSGTGTGSVSSSPAGISCPSTCSATYPGSTSVVLTAAPTAGSTFTGWSGACAGAGTCTVLMDKAQSVNAQFTLQTYDVTVTKAGSGSGFVSSSPTGIDCGSDCVETYGHGTSVTLTATASVGSRFTGWTGACTGVTPCVLSATAARSVTATFTLDRKLTVAKAGLGSGRVTSSPAGIVCGDDCTELYKEGTSVTLTQVPSAGSTFAGWTGSCTGSTTCVVKMTAARTVTATYTLDSQTLAVSKTGGGSGTVTSSPAGISCGATCSAPYAANTVVTLSAAPASGSTFTGWSGAGCTGTSTCSVTMTQATAVTAEFALVTQLLTVNRTGAGTGFVTSNPGGINCGSDCTEAYPTGTSVTLTAMPAKGSSFAGWSGGGCTGTDSCTVSLATPTTVSASFTVDTQTLTVARAGTGVGTVSSSPAGISCGADCTEAYAGGTVATLTAAPSAGSSFLGWSGACTGTGTCTVTMTESRSVTASFTLDDQTLTVDQGGAGTGTISSNPAGISCGVDCSEVYPGGTSVTLTATPDPTSTFTGWSGACSGTGPCTVVMTAARTVVAGFGLADQPLSVSRAGTGLGTVTSSPAGITCGTACTATFPASTVVTLTATSASGSAFLGWSGDCTGTGTCAVDMTSARNVTASFDTAAVPAGTYENTDTAVKYAGSWSTSSNANDSGGSVRFAGNGPASATLTFSGTKVVWVSRTQASSGSNAVYLDGVLVGTVDRYSSSTRFKVAVFTSATLSTGTHTLRIEHTGSKNPAATDDNVLLDAFVVS